MRRPGRASCVTIRLLPHDAVRLIEQARARNVTVSKLIRDALLEVDLIDDDAGQLVGQQPLPVAS